MLLSPKYPQPPTASTAPVITSAALPQDPQHVHAPACHCQPSAPARRTVPTVGVIAGAVAAVVTVGIVLTALLVAVTVAAVSVAVVAVVLRSLLTPPRQR